MRKKQILVLLSALLLGVVAAAYGQNAISAKSGMVNYFEGKVLLNGESLAYDRATFHQIPEGGTLEATEQGRAEVLLSPGVMMWVGEGAKVELVSDSLLNAKVRLLSGGVVISGTEFTDDMSLTVLVNGDSVTIRKAGIYRFDAAPASLYVYDGEATVLRADGETKVKKGRTLALAQPEAELAKFDKDETTGLMLWAQSRDNYIQTASLSAARSIGTGGYPSLSYSGLSGYGYWLYNPFFGMYTFVPMSGSFMSPWGSYYYYTPRTVINAYAPYIYGGGGSRRGASSNSGFSRGGFDASTGGFGDYSRGASSMGMGGYGGGRSMGASSAGSYSRGASAVGGGAAGGGASVPTSSSGASMGRGGSSVGRGGGGGRP